MHATVLDEKRNVMTPVTACRSCQMPVYFSLTEAGKVCPFDVDDEGKATRVSHFTTCSDPKRWTKKR